MAFEFGCFYPGFVNGFGPRFTQSGDFIFHFQDNQRVNGYCVRITSQARKGGEVFRLFQVNPDFLSGRNLGRNHINGKKPGCQGAEC